jgi:hypothetical protein
MKPGWSDKDDRLYRRIFTSCLKRRSARECQRIASVVVAQQRRVEGRDLGEEDTFINPATVTAMVATLAIIVSMALLKSRS